MGGVWVRDTKKALRPVWLRCQQWAGRWFILRWNYRRRVGRTVACLKWSKWLPGRILNFWRTIFSFWFMDKSFGLRLKPIFMQDTAFSHSSHAMVNHVTKMGFRNNRLMDGRQFSSNIKPSENLWVFRARGCSTRIGVSLLPKTLILSCWNEYGNLKQLKRIRI